MKAIAADLHIHTALSPCALSEMTPAAIVSTAAARGLDLIAICDHNAAGNGPATFEAAARHANPHRVAVLAGIEITTAEEAHLLGVFSDPEAALDAASVVQCTLSLPADKTLKPGEEWLTYAASRLTLNDAIRLIKRHGGLAIASHVDRPSYSVTSQLGMVPVDAPFDALEISAAGRALGRAHRFAPLGFPLVTSSDSHSLDEIGAARTWLNADTASFEELACALRRVAGREVLGLGGAEDYWEGMPGV